MIFSFSSFYYSFYAFLFELQVNFFLKTKKIANIFGLSLLGVSVQVVMYLISHISHKFLIMIIVTFLHNTIINKCLKTFLQLPTFLLINTHTQTDAYTRTKPDLRPTTPSLTKRESKMNTTCQEAKHTTLQSKQDTA